MEILNQVKFRLGKISKGVEVSVNGEFDAKGFTKGSVELGIDGALSLLPKTITEAAPVDISLKGDWVLDWNWVLKESVIFM